LRKPGYTRRAGQANTRVVPALALDAPYLSRLSARSALYTELRLLLDANYESLSSAEYCARVLEENCLARASMAARKKLWKELKSRYLLDREQPLFAAFWREWRQCKSEPERGLTAYILLALNDRLVADLGTEWLFGYLRRAPAELRTEDVRHFIEHAVLTHPEVQAWTEHTRAAVAQKYLASIRDFGIARGRVKKVTIFPALYGAPVRLLIRALQLVAVQPLELLQAPVFRLLALDEREIIDALGQLNRLGELRFRMQGDVIELNVDEEG
jgi:BrxA